MYFQTKLYVKEMSMIADKVFAYVVNDGENKVSIRYEPAPVEAVRTKDWKGAFQCVGTVQKDLSDEDAAELNTLKDREKNDKPAWVKGVPFFLFDICVGPSPGGGGLGANGGKK